MPAQISIKQIDIIKAAAKVINASGFGGLTIKNLANEIGFTEGALYRHFKSKDEIILTLLEFLTVKMENNYKEVPLDLQPEAYFIRLVNSQIAFLKAHPHFVAIAFSDGLVCNVSAINKALENLNEMIAKYLYKSIKIGQHKRIFTHLVSTEDLVTIVTGTLKLQLFKWKLAGYNYDINKSGNKMIQAILTLIKAH